MQFLPSRHMTELTRDFVEKRIVPLSRIPGAWMVEEYGNVYNLDLRMCFLTSLRYAFAWGDDTVPVLSVMPIIEQPSRILKVDVSLNDLRFLDDQALKTFREARSLNAAVNRIDSFPGVGMLPKLLFLDLGYNYVSSLEDLQHSQNLVELRLNHNTLSSLRTLPLLPQLIILNIDGNSLISLDGLPSLPRLRELSARRNAIQNIVALTPCRQLESIDLGGNRIGDLDVVVGTLQQLKYLKDVTLKDNPCALHPTYTRTMKAMFRLKSLDGVALFREDGKPLDDEEMALGGNSEMMHFRRAAREAYMDRIRQSRIAMEENVRYLQKKIISMMDGQRDFEKKMIHEMNSTLDHIDVMDRIAADQPRRRTPTRLPGIGGYEGDAPVPMQMKRSDHKDPDDVLRLASLRLARDMRKKKDDDLNLKNVPLDREFL